VLWVRECACSVLLGKTNARLQHLSSWDKSRCWPPQSVFNTGVKRSSSTVKSKTKQEKYQITAKRKKQPTTTAKKIPKIFKKYSKKIPNQKTK